LLDSDSLLDKIPEGRGREIEEEGERERERVGER
jgi:hypothetical protein